MEWFSLPQIVGYVAYVSSFYACAQKDDKRLFKFFGYSWILFGLHHYMMGNDTAAVSAALIGIRPLERLGRRLSLFPDRFGHGIFDLCFPGQPVAVGRVDRRHLRRVLLERDPFKNDLYIDKLHVVRP